MRSSYLQNFPDFLQKNQILKSCEIRCRCMSQHLRVIRSKAHRLCEVCGGFGLLAELPHFNAVRFLLFLFLALLNRLVGFILLFVLHLSTCREKLCVRIIIQHLPVLITHRSVLSNFVHFAIEQDSGPLASIHLIVFGLRLSFIKEDLSFGVVPHVPGNDKLNGTVDRNDTWNGHLIPMEAGKLHFKQLSLRQNCTINCIVDCMVRLRFECPSSLLDSTSSCSKPPSKYCLSIWVSQETHHFFLPKCASRSHRRNLTWCNNECQHIIILYSLYLVYLAIKNRI